MKFVESKRLARGKLKILTELKRIKELTGMESFFLPEDSEVYDIDDYLGKMRAIQDNTMIRFKYVKIDFAYLGCPEDPYIIRKDVNKFPKRARAISSSYRRRLIQNLEVGPIAVELNHTDLDSKITNVKKSLKGFELRESGIKTKMTKIITYCDEDESFYCEEKVYSPTNKNAAGFLIAKKLASSDEETHIPDSEVGTDNKKRNDRYTENSVRAFNGRIRDNLGLEEDLIKHVGKSELSLGREEHPYSRLSDAFLGGRYKHVKLKSEIPKITAN